MSSPQCVTVGGKKVPLMTSAKQPAKKCCCGGVSCNTIPFSLCRESALTWDGCGYAEFTDPSATPPIEKSCPPKFYRKMTLEASFSEIIKQSVWGCDYADPTEVDTVYSQTRKEVLTKAIGDEGCKETSDAICEAHWSDPDNSECCSWIWDWDGEKFVQICDFRSQTMKENSSSDCGDVHMVIPSLYSYHYPSLDWHNWKATSPTTAEGSVYLALQYPFAVGVNVKGTLTLSDEITLHDTLLKAICAEISCDPATDSGCRSCCDESGPFKKYHNTGTCIVPGSSPMTWDNSSCSANTRSGQSSRLSLWFSGLTVGQCYQVTLTFGRCEFAKDGEGHYLVPTCESGVPCTDAPNETFTQTLPIFQAEAWGEMLTDDCGRCDIAAILCWLNANKPEGATVACTIGAIDVPAIQNHYTWFSSCSIVSVECPTPP